MPLLPKPLDCQGCPLHDQSPVGFTQPEGLATLHLAALGEAAGEHEQSDGLPFRPRGQAGAVLERVFKRTGHSRDQLRLYNTIQCHPPKNWLEGAPWELAAINHCKVHRDRFVGETRPNALLALGGIPTRTLTGLSGKKQGVAMLRGYVLPAVDYKLPDGSPMPVIPTLYPSFIARGASRYLGAVYRDVMFAFDVAQKGWTWRGPEDLNFRYRPMTDWLEAEYRKAREHPDWPIFYDLETSTSIFDNEDEIDTANIHDKIESVQGAVGLDGQCFFLPWIGEYIIWFDRLMALPNPKMAFNNYLFDDPILKVAGTRINGVRHDLMWAWHHSQPDLDANLQFVASFYDMPFVWKHLAGAQAEAYGCCDIYSLQLIARRVFDQLRHRGLYESYERHIVQLRLCLEKAEARGIPVNDEKRIRLGEELSVERDVIFVEIQATVPDEVKGAHPPKGYKVLPKEVKDLLEVPPAYVEPLPVTLTKAGKPRKAKVSKVKPAWLAMDTLEERAEVLARMATLPTPKVPGTKDEDADTKGAGVWDILPFEIMDPTTKQVDRPWRLCIRKPFLPNSTDHIIRYMKFRGHPVPRTFKEERETTEAVELERLAKRTRDTMYTRILDYRRIAKMKSTYVDGWKPGADGRVHTQFTFRPATGQLSSRNPNAQNTPKRAALASRFNEILEAPPGYKLVEIDYSSFHVLTTGYEAKDPVYYRMARLDPHSFLASYMRSVNRPIDPSLPDEQILRLTSEIKKEFKSVRNNQAKPGILGYGFGLGINNFYNQNIEHFRNRAEAQEVYDLLDRLFPVAKKWRDQIRKQAHSQGYLISKHGYIRHFHEVYKWDPKRQGLVPGNDSEAAIAFLPANDAFGHIKEAMLRVEEMGANERYGFVNQIHDSLMFCCPDRLVMECLKVVSREMLRPSTYLADPILCPEGLWCGVEAGVGQCRAAMEGVSLERIWEVAA